MNKENEKERRVEELETVKQEAGSITKDDVIKALERMRNGNAEL